MATADRLGPFGLTGRRAIFFALEMVTFFWVVTVLLEIKRFGWSIQLGFLVLMLTLPPVIILVDHFLYLLYVGCFKVRLLWTGLD